MSRVQALSQIFILESACPEKIKASREAMEELEKMTRKSDKDENKIDNSIISCNIRSIQKNIENFKTSSAFKRACVVCLQETWLDPYALVPNFLDGWEQHVNSVGRGKGIITCYKTQYSWDRNITRAKYQLTKIISNSQDIINVYRSAGANDDNFIEDLQQLINLDKDVLILGDFNICYKSHGNNKVFEELKSLGFQQLVEFPTHMEGHLLDLVFSFSTDGLTANKVSQQSQFFTDHDLIEVFR